MKTSRSCCLLGLVATVTVLMVGTTSHAEQSTGAGLPASCPPTCVDVDEDAFTLATGQVRPGGASSPRRLTGGPQEKSARGHTSVTIREQALVPTCTGNSPGGTDDLCAAALNLCEDDTLIRFWLYVRERNRLAGNASPWTRVDPPPFVCRGAEDPAVTAAVDPAVLIAAMVQRDFQRLVVLKGVAEVSPSPDTLINIPTRFSTAAPATYDIPLTLLGQPVVITATAQRFVWHFGDGTSTATAEPNGRVEHVYRRPAERGASVDIDWSGTFSIGGGPSQPIAGVATTVGEPTVVAVKQARTELVEGSA